MCWYTTDLPCYKHVPLLHMHPMMNINGLKKSPFCSSLCLELQVQTRGQHTIKKNANMWLILAACYIHLRFSEYIIQRTFKCVNQIINLNCHWACTYDYTTTTRNYYNEYDRIQVVSNIYLVTCKSSIFH
jgi:hypothetical protein